MGSVYPKGLDDGELTGVGVNGLTVEKADQSKTQGPPRQLRDQESAGRGVSMAPNASTSKQSKLGCQKGAWRGRCFLLVPNHAKSYSSLDGGVEKTCA